MAVEQIHRALPHRACDAGPHRPGPGPGDPHLVIDVTLGTTSPTLTYILYRASLEDGSGSAT